MRSETPDPWVRRSRSGQPCASLHCEPALGDHAATMRAPGRYRATACTSASRSMSQNSSRVYPRLSDSTASCRLTRSEEHTSELQSHSDLVCRLLLEKKKKKQRYKITRV